MSDETELRQLEQFPRKELENYCASLRENALRLGELVNELQTENGHLRAEVKDLSEKVERYRQEVGRLNSLRAPEMTKNA
ncbi:hypothetical protein [Geminisphaera colitermitum]|uniref:hypothetical protein n=1 Tax=Geminisphaera colitermitum TaxID=1148786 RepID=UPI000158C81A|nr:hypothetical protein [Geminisphaera colitermitum]